MRRRVPFNFSCGGSESLAELLQNSGAFGDIFVVKGRELQVDNAARARGTEFPIFCHYRGGDRLITSLPWRVRIRGARGCEVVNWLLHNGF